MSCLDVPIQTILGTECIGDSLPKIMGNFNTLGDATCDLITKVNVLSSSVTSFFSSAGSAWKNISSTYTAINNDRIAANTSGGAFTVTLPASPAFGANVTFIDHTKTWDTNNLTIARNGQLIEGLGQDLICDVVGDMVITLIYNGSTWRVYA